jgi:hypothetical protein
MKPDVSTQRIFVEGANDGAVINKLIAARLGFSLSAPPSHRIIDAPIGDGGFDEALRRFSAALTAQRPARLVLVVDRDGHDGKPDRWLAVAAALKGVGAQVDEPGVSGTRLELSWGRVGVWLMPDNRSPGDLESLLVAMLPSTAGALWAHATEATDQARALGARWRDPHRSKACLHTWLAWQDPPGNPYGTAIEAGLFRLDVPAADRFCEWFRWLVGP